ncbi:MAG: c-type cytochrome [Bacteroidia bacterium]
MKLPNEKHPLIKDKLLAYYVGALHLIIIALVMALFVSWYIQIYQPDVSSWLPKREEMSEGEKKWAFEKLKVEEKKKAEMASFWQANDIQQVGDAKQKALIEYGKELITHTAKYLGPKGSIMQITNGMNCQNCHLEAGTKIWGNNYGSVFSTYPKYRARSGTEEDIFKRVNDCIERSLNGKSLSKESPEMQAITSYIEFVGKNVKKGEKAKGSGIFELPYLERAIDPAKGKILYEEKCQSCHQANGEGLLADDKIEYIYPPLWGKNAYNFGAGLYRMSRFAGYIKYNMPQGTAYPNAQLSDEQAWDLAAFVNSQPHPSKDLSKDWPKIEEKPIDHPFAPFTDNFSQEQHKLGPFKPIAAEKKKQKEAKEKAAKAKSS